MTWEVHPFYRCPTVCCVGGWKLLYKHCEIYTGWQAGSYGTRFFFPPLLLLHSWCRYTPLKVVSNVFVVVMMHWCLLQPSRTWMWFCFFGPAYVAVTSVWILMMWHLWLRWQLQKKRFPEISKKPNNDKKSQMKCHYGDVASWAETLIMFQALLLWWPWYKPTILCPYLELFVIFWVECETCFCISVSSSALRGECRKWTLTAQGLFSFLIHCFLFRLETRR